MNFFSVFYTTILFSTVFHLTNSASTGCGQEVLVGCVRSLSILSENSEIGFAAKREELDRICPDLNEGLRCIDDFTRRCMAPRQRAHFNELYAGSSMVIQEICQEGPYQEEFLKHAPCMREVKADYEECARDYQQKLQSMGIGGNDTKLSSQDNEYHVKRLCCSFQEYLKCSHAIVKDTCGEETAVFTKSFLDRMSYSLIQGHCGRYSPNSEECEEGSSSSPVTCIINTSLLLLLLSIVVFFQRT